MKEILDAIADFTNKVTRPWITILFVIATIYGFITDKIDGATFIGMGGIAIGFWFNRREDDKSV